MKQPPTPTPVIKVPRDTETPRSSPRVRSSPKHRGIQFDNSRRNSSPKSRSSREKEEEAFRTTVAQNLSLSSEPILRKNPAKAGLGKTPVTKAASERNVNDKYNPQQNLKGRYNPIQKLRDKFISDNTAASKKICNDPGEEPGKSRLKENPVEPVILSDCPLPKGPIKTNAKSIMTSRCDDGSVGTPERDVVPRGPYVPSPTLDPPENVTPTKDNEIELSGRDGMEEYAAAYTEPTTSSQDGKQRDTRSQTVEEVEHPQDAVANRGELREPDGASGSSSPAVLPPKEPVAQKPTNNAKDSPVKDKDQKPRSRDQKQSRSDIKVPLLPGEASSVQKSSFDPKEAPSSDVPNIPSTNIAVAFLVTLCFNLPFGALAIYFSLMATKAYRDGDKVKGAKKARISIYISLFSIVLTVLIVMTVVLMEAIQGQAKRRRYSSKTGVHL